MNIHLTHPRPSTPLFVCHTNIASRAPRLSPPWSPHIHALMRCAASHSRRPPSRPCPSPLCPSAQNAPQERAAHSLWLCRRETLRRTIRYTLAAAARAFSYLDWGKHHSLTWFLDRNARVFNFTRPGSVWLGTIIVPAPLFHKII